MQSQGSPTHPKLPSRDEKSSRSSSDVQKPQEGFPVEGIGVSPGEVQAFPEMQYEDLRRTRLELEVARDRYATLFDSTPVGYVIIDGNGRILEANLTLCHLVGMSRKDILHKKFEQYVDPDDQGVFYRYLDFLRQTPGTHPSDVLTLQSSNTPHRVRLEGWMETREPSGMASLFRIAVKICDDTETN